MICNKNNLCIAITVYTKAPMNNITLYQFRFEKCTNYGHIKNCFIQLKCIIIWQLLQRFYTFICKDGLYIYIHIYGMAKAGLPTQRWRRVWRQPRPQLCCCLSNRYITRCMDWIHPLYLIGASEITANLYCNCVHLYLEGCVICSIYLR